ncbi:PCI domain-containing protein 2 [Smittium culicis]|uniref:PCI domain-containing protein 2 n=1 Tax=Smittium culicis TaxID=133412 RepID=A0A1R1YKJ5_9FUNG|nr:PCI domain-containing protein 2 [Smittium culicis]
MSNRNISNLVKEIVFAIKSQNSQALSNIFSADPNYTPSTQSCLSRYEILHVNNSLKDPWNQMLLSHFEVLQALSIFDYEKAYDFHSKTIISFLKIFVKQKRWALPFMYSLNFDMIKLSKLADLRLISQGKDPAIQMKAAWIANKLFSACITDSVSPELESRKWEKVRELVLRKFFRRIYLILGSTRIHINYFKAALDSVNYSAGNVDPMEVHCIISNMISKNFIKGYLSESHNTLVLSKADPFPSLFKRTSSLSPLLLQK